MLKRKEKEYNDMLINKLVASVNSQKDFWENVHNISLKKKQPQSSLAVDDWFNNFKTLLETDIESESSYPDVDEHHVRDNTNEDGEELI